jgi:hypothetical protein
MAFSLSVLVGEADGKADLAVSADKKLDNAEAGSALSNIVPASQSGNRTSKTVQAVKVLIFGVEFQRQRDGKGGGWESTG